MIKNRKNKKILHKIICNFLETRPFFFSWLRPQEAFLFQKNNNLLQSPFLDFGCGDGLFSYIALKDTGKIIDVGLDVKSSRIKEMRKYDMFYKKTEIYDGKIIPYSNDTFMSVMSNSVLEHIPHLEISVSEISRVIKRDGYFLTTVMTDMWEKNLLGKNIFGKSYSDWLRKKQYHFNLFSLKEWNSVFEKAGFEICSISPTLPPRLVHAMEIAHYFSIPSLISYVFLKKWVFWSSWYQFFGVDSFVENKLEVELKDFISFKDEEIKNIDLQNALHDIQDLKNKDIGNSGSLFYVLRKR